MHMNEIYLTYSGLLLYAIYLLRFEFPNRDRTIFHIENAHQRHLRIRIDKYLILFGNQFPGIFLVYTWYIPCKSMYLVYTRYGIYQVYTWYKLYTMYIPGIYYIPCIYHEKTFWGFQMESCPGIGNNGHNSDINAYNSVKAAEDVALWSYCMPSRISRCTSVLAILWSVKQLCTGPGFVCKAVSKLGVQTIKQWD